VKLQYIDNKMSKINMLEQITEITRYRKYTDMTIYGGLIWMYL